MNSASTNILWKPRLILEKDKDCRTTRMNR